MAISSPWEMRTEILMLPVPDAPLDLYAPGQNFSSWVDRLVLGSHVYARNAPIPFEPEGLLGTLPSIAQALMGALAGMLIRARGCTRTTLIRMLGAGLVLTALGVLLAPFHPVVKATWSSTFVLVTTGLALLTFASLIWCLDIRGWQGPLAHFAQAFGINAITAYVVHTYAMGPLLLNSITWEMHGQLADIMPPALAMLLPVMLVVLVSWIPVAVMKHKGIILKV